MSTTQHSEADTRHRILMHVLRHGPVSATDISDEFGLSAAGVRRHLDNIVAQGLAETVTGPKSGQRGRPAKLFRLTDKGRAKFGHDYDTLAVLALRALRNAGGEEAVENFAHERIIELLGSAEEMEGAPSSDDVVARARFIAERLTEKGYAATVNDAATGVQICRHHCPIQDVAHEFPELCAAEHRVVAELLGQHTQPLATIADGNGICTTHIPLTTISPSPKKES
ncbi:transcriptional regulator [Corynebacterium sp. 320]|uniref:Transcriptional regulator n=1 Tax=Corynebacterium zhongnanshanii TaxID=2768834 RepID=A0ABQ6VGE5_9CORY|nr:MULTISPECIES: metalloregulator ArsR/SmtB family transcription factor [Corynebacterium]KAB1503668.1 transcriptional regulator [Corynebacterium sp. 320]KAB1553231.1 transcriptional regulator [Corynebacterium sp. 321]KAB1553550.1 transcriptional regulator [Corynebacterium sp. 319]KAB3523481.1 transcriptional regulator [Corynebacterium zhongnanshanii]KAB3527804.1 transcriptional regulator [Corynebacterium sp. 250]